MVRVGADIKGRAMCHVPFVFRDLAERLLGMPPNNMPDSELEHSQSTSF